MVKEQCKEVGRAGLWLSCSTFCLDKPFSVDANSTTNATNSSLAQPTETEAANSSSPLVAGSLTDNAPESPDMDGCTDKEICFNLAGKTHFVWKPMLEVTRLLAALSVCVSMVAVACALVRQCNWNFYKDRVHLALAATAGFLGILVIIFYPVNVVFPDADQWQPSWQLDWTYYVFLSGCCTHVLVVPLLCLGPRHSGDDTKGADVEGGITSPQRGSSSVSLSSSSSSLSSSRPPGGLSTISTLSSL
ncbi:uncharacterized protein LOC101849618 isoform X2 [Aplysia californica]|uniref:Uncharacterized protein LOC101849618 isoform X2 n=1 Tax=Aplysia californica TaxID=6500 RepID=A0ABM0JPU7_APLCA|nr:uncharacterized protein LOC101849618 isoform X2 [Aplysia californica]